MGAATYPPPVDDASSGEEVVRFSTCRPFAAAKDDAYSTRDRSVDGDRLGTSDMVSSSSSLSAARSCRRCLDDRTP